ncbi:hypothetical protein E2P81_ATG09299 [Venturia nashicola]|uniref:Uncharacterized protein n=1 Tax=Venturia nashicola TaxID=86259 RepID=A0A4Z1P2A9_9PEZI|nr:hypothetical protein E6O75_ATG09505 [Venturia nashicola]TLD20229.1 hypothetical protein E2P81_ATG09299 [Venturia nashicola]
MSRANIAKHYSRILSQWPKDLIRPEVQFQRVIQARAANAASIHEGQETAELKNVNALYSLLDNRYTKKVLSRSKTVAKTDLEPYILRRPALPAERSAYTIKMVEFDDEVEGAGEVDLIW